MSILRGYEWPGNIRELRNIIERAVILAKGHIIEEEDIALGGTAPSPAEDNNPLPAGGHTPLLAGGHTASPAIEDVVMAHIISVLESVSGNRTRAAKLLGISRSTLIEKLKTYKIEENANRDSETSSE